MKDALDMKSSYRYWVLLVQHFSFLIIFFSWIIENKGILWESSNEVRSR